MTAIFFREDATKEWRLYTKTDRKLSSWEVVNFFEWGFPHVKSFAYEGQRLAVWLPTGEILSPISEGIDIRKLRAIAEADADTMAGKLVTSGVARIMIDQMI